MNSDCGQNRDLTLRLDDGGLCLCGEKERPAGGGMGVMIELSGKWRRYACELRLENGAERFAGGVQYMSHLCAEVPRGLLKAGILRIRVAGGDLLTRELSQAVPVRLLPEAAG